MFFGGIIAIARLLTVVQFHEMVMITEGAKIDARGFQDGNLAGMVIGLPPVLNFAKPEIKDRVLAEVLSGKKKICLAISEVCTLLYKNKDHV
jgi:hypothetical protein